MATLREAQKRMTREMLLDAGLEMFGRKGYAAATIDDIAKAAGATRTTFYLHFPSKADLVSQLLDRAEQIMVTTDGPPLSEVVRLGDRTLIRAWLDSRVAQWDTIKPYMLAIYEASHETHVAERTEQWFEDVAGQMADGLAKAGRFDPSIRRVRAILAFGELEYLSRRYFVIGWRLDRDVVMEELTSSWVRLLTEG
jgi:AcrR family transcriptional regulator